MNNNGKALQKLSGLGYSLKKVYFSSDLVQVWELSHDNPDKPRFWVDVYRHYKLGTIAYSYKQALCLRKGILIKYPSLKAKLKDLVF